MELLMLFHWTVNRTGFFDAALGTVHTECCDETVESACGACDDEKVSI
jgi:hypothetical protein